MICIIQARIDSKRFKGKVLKKIQRKPILNIIYSRLLKLKQIDQIVVATTNRNIDKRISGYCKLNNIKCFKGPLNNLIKRYLDCGNYYGEKDIIRITGDSPLVDINIIKKMLKIYKTKKFDLVTNVFPRSFPKGLSVEIFKLKTLKKVLENKINKLQKEHMLTYVYSNYKKFKINNYKSSKDYSKLNLSIDTINDFNEIKKLLKQSRKDIIDISYLELIRLNEKN